MKKNFKLLLGVLTAVIFFLLSGMSSASAASYQVNYTIEKYGTTQTSVADAYFVKPATVVVENNQYSVQMTVKTNHNLGSFPVQILNVNGQTPQIQKQTSGDSDYYIFTFNTATVRKTLSGNMKVDIDNINYHHYYGFDIALDAGQVPDLTQSQPAQTTAAQSQQTSAASQSSATTTTAAVASNSNSAASSKNVSSTSNVSSVNSNSSSAVSSSEKKASHVTSKKATAKAKSSGKENNNKSSKQETHKKKNNSVLSKAAMTLAIIGGLGIGAWGVIHNYRG